MATAMEHSEVEANKQHSPVATAIACSVEPVKVKGDIVSSDGKNIKKN